MARPGWARRGAVRYGLAWQGKAMRGWVRLGREELGDARRRGAIRSVALLGEAGQGVSWHGDAGRCDARQGLCK